jgi:hypothetical protein
VYTIKAVIPAMRVRGRGWIVNLSSVAGKLGQPDEAVYSATKFAITGLSEARLRAGAARHPRDGGLSSPGPHRDVHARILERMPARALRTFIEAPEFTRQVLRALERGQHEVTVPPLRRDRVRDPRAFPCLSSSHDRTFAPAGSSRSRHRKRLRVHPRTQQGRGVVHRRLAALRFCARTQGFPL